MTRSQLGTDANLYAEDIVIPSTPYPAGGYSLTVTKGSILQKVRSVIVKVPASTGQGTTVACAAVVGSESGQTFLLKLYTTGATTGGYLQELGAVIYAEGLTVSVIYEATA
jgi:hypothetical protein